MSILAEKLRELAALAESDALHGVGFIWGCGPEAYIVVSKTDVAAKAVLHAMHQEICPEDMVKPIFTPVKRKYTKRKIHESAN